MRKMLPLAMLAMTIVSLFVPAVLSAGYSSGDIPGIFIPTCGCRVPGSGCTFNPIFPIYECYPEGVFDALRSAEGYFGEDDDYFYFKAIVSDPIHPETGTYTNDDQGTWQISCAKEWVLEWIDAGCPSGE